MKPSEQGVPYGCDAPLIRLVTWLHGEHDLLLTWPMGSSERADRAIAVMGLDALGEAMAEAAKATQSTDAACVLDAVAKGAKT